LLMLRQSGSSRMAEFLRFSWRFRLFRDSHLAPELKY
jgi:hypothetical protein